MIAKLVPRQLQVTLVLSPFLATSMSQNTFGIPSSSLPVIIGSARSSKRIGRNEPETVLPSFFAYSTPWIQRPKKLYPRPPSQGSPSSCVHWKLASAIVPGEAKRKDGVGKSVRRYVAEVLKRTEWVVKVAFCEEIG